MPDQDLTTATTDVASTPVETESTRVLPPDYYLG